MDELRLGLWEIVHAGQPMTVRQVFYRAVSAGLIEKTEAEYNGTIGRLLTEMRLAYHKWTQQFWFKEALNETLDGVVRLNGARNREEAKLKILRDRRAIPFAWIVDNTRWMRKPHTWDSVEEALQETAQFYRRRLWANQDVYVEVWLEKEALAGVIYPITAEFDVPLMVTRGYPSISYVYNAAETIAALNKPTTIYYLGDHDPSGVDIPRNVEDRLREFAPDADITFERLAVTPEQIREMGLPTRPTKKTDTRSKSFDGDSVEVDAIDPDDLRQLVLDAIEWHIDESAFEVTKVAEESEREILQRIAETKGAA